MADALKQMDGTCNAFAARKAARYLSAAYDRALAPSGLRITQFALLQKLASRGPLSISELAAAVVMDRTTLAQNTKPLMRDGLVVVETSSEDKRVRVVRITESGRKRFATALPLWKQAQHAFEKAYGRDAAKDLRSRLHDVLQTGLDPWAESP